MEAFIEAGDLGLISWTLAAGNQTGFDVGHDVSYPPGETGSSGNRRSQHFWRIALPSTGGLFDYPFMNENAFCTATLLAP